MKIFGTKKIRNMTRRKRLDHAILLQFLFLFLLGLFGIIEPIVPVLIGALVVISLIGIRLAVILATILKNNENKPWAIITIVILGISFLLSLIMDSFYMGMFAIALFGMPPTVVLTIIFAVFNVSEKQPCKGAINYMPQNTPKQDNGFVEQLDGLYSAIPSGKKSPISKQVKYIREASIQAFEAIDKNPALASRANDLTDYCFPQTLKLLEDYLDFSKKKVKGENIEKILEKIVQSLDAMCDAIDKQLNSLYTDKMMDVKTDMVVVSSIANKE